MWDYKILSSPEPPHEVLLNQEGLVGFELACIVFSQGEWRTYLKREAIELQLRRLEDVMTLVDSFRDENNPPFGLSEYLLDRLTERQAMTLLERYAAGGNEEARDTLVLWHTFGIIHRIYTHAVKVYLQTARFDSAQVGFYASQSCVILRWQGNTVYLNRESLPYIAALFSNDQVDVDLRTGEIIATKRSDGITLRQLDGDLIVIHRSNLQDVLAMLSIAITFCMTQYAAFIDMMHELAVEDYRRRDVWDYDDMYDSPGGVMRARFREEHGRDPEEGEL